MKAAAVAAAAFISAPQVASAATTTMYNGYWDDGYHSGYFWARDDDQNKVLTQSELGSFRMVFDNSNGGPGQYRYVSTSVRDFLFTITGTWVGTMSGIASYEYRRYHCGTWGTPPCMPGETPYSTYTGEQSFSLDNVGFVTTVPGPAALPLLAGGLAAFGFFRRRRAAV